MSATLAAAVAMHSEMGDPVANLDRIEEWVDKAHEAGATFAVFPEECITGSLNKTDLPGDEIERIVTDAVRLSRPRLESLAARYRMTLVVGTIDKRGEKYGNAALIVGPDGYIATFYKLWLPNENESEFFEVGDELLVVGSQGWKFSIGICADMNRGEYFRAAADNGAELMLMPIAGSGYADLVGPRGGQSRQARKHRSLHLKMAPSPETPNLRSSWSGNRTVSLNVSRIIAAAAASNNPRVTPTIVFRRVWGTIGPPGVRTGSRSDSVSTAVN